MSFKKSSKPKKKQGPTLDLHGMNSSDAYDAIEEFIYKHSQKGTAKVKIMPGKGTGTIKSEVVKYLKQAGYAWHYETLPNGKQNTGVLIVPMD